MVKRHSPSRPEAIVVKSGRQRSRLQEKARCVVCGATLASDHNAVGDLVCGVHPRDGGDPRSAAPVTMTLSPEERLLVMLYRAAPEPLNVHRAFGCPSTATNMAWFRDAVKRLNVRIGPVRGHLHVGYKLASVRGGRGVKVGV